MNTLTLIEQWLETRSQLVNKTIGFIPTMGHLHDGHLALCQRARADNDLVVVSIFVNPTQFNRPDDLARYPRTLAQDQEKLVASGVDYLFCPTARQMYPDNYEVQVTENAISTLLEGVSRPGHFNGMLTVVLKLLNLVAPTRAYFGEKDYQQLLLVKKMVAALFLPVDIIGCETVRAEDSLALSSRNSRLTAALRQKAAAFPTYLHQAKTAQEAQNALTALGFKVDYIAEEWQRRLGAVWIDDVRLIDNVSLEKAAELGG